MKKDVKTSTGSRPEEYIKQCIEHGNYIEITVAQTYRDRISKDDVERDTSWIAGEAGIKLSVIRSRDPLLKSARKKGIVIGDCDYIVIGDISYDSVFPIAEIFNDMPCYVAIMRIED